MLLELLRVAGLVLYVVLVAFFWVCVGCGAVLWGIASAARSGSRR